MDLYSGWNGRRIGQASCWRPNVSGRLHFYQVVGVHPGMIYTLNVITSHHPAEVGFHNGNEGILDEYGLNDFI